MKKEVKLGMIVVGVVVGLVIVFGGINYMFNLSQSTGGFLGELFTSLPTPDGSGTVDLDLPGGCRPNMNPKPSGYGCNGNGDAIAVRCGSDGKWKISSPYVPKICSTCRPGPGCV